MAYDLGKKMRILVDSTWNLGHIYSIKTRAMLGDFPPVHKIKYKIIRQ